MNEIKAVLSSGVKKFVCASMHGDPVKDISRIQASMHPRMEFLFVLHGKSRFMMNDMLYDAEPGNMFVIDPWLTHASGYFPDDHDLLHLWLHLHKKNFVGNFIKVADSGQIKLFYPAIQFSYDITDLIWRRWNMAKKVDGIITVDSLQKYLCAPLHLVLDEVLIYLNQEQKKDPIDKNIIDSVKQYIQTAHGCRCSLTEIETYTGYNRFYISHLFKKKVGLTIGEYINDVRTKYTVEAELHGIRHTIIAQELGFSSIAAFCFWYKKNRNKINDLKDKSKEE